LNAIVLWTIYTTDSNISSPFQCTYAQVSFRYLGVYLYFKTKD